MTSNSPAPTRRIPGLDGVRGAAVLAVIVFHWRQSVTTGQMPGFLHRLSDLGWSGVDLFFVLSGFLITGILLDSRESSRYFRVFYARRALRIFPLYFAYLTFVLAVIRPVWQWYTGKDLWAGMNPFWYLAYLQNWKPGYGAHDPLLEHLWSLAIEEQFYIVWPLTVWFSSRRSLTWITAGVGFFSLACRCFMTYTGTEIEPIYRLTLPRADALAWGAFVAVGMREFPALLKRWCRPVSVAAILVFLIVWMRATTLWWNDSAIRTIGVSALDLGFACLVYLVACGRGACFLNPMLRSFGKYSYGMYVCQVIPLYLTLGWARTISGPWAMTLKGIYFIALVSVVYGLSRLSWWLLESRFLKLKASIQ